MLRLLRCPVWLVPSTLALALSGAAADGRHGGPSPSEPAIRFERVECQLCIQESYAVGTVSAPPLRLSGFAPPVTSAMTRTGEVRAEVLRGYRPGQVGEQFALRINLIILSGSPSPTTYRFASGLVDEDHLAVMAAALAELARALETLRSGPRPADSAEIHFQAGSIRFGGLVTQAGSVAYVQAADRNTVPAPSPWESVSALFLQPGELPALRQIVDGAMRRIQELRGR